MTKREAKRRACSAAARLLDPNLSGDNHYLWEDLTRSDADRMREAVTELCDELYRRGATHKPGLPEMDGK